MRRVHGLVVSLLLAFSACFQDQGVPGGDDDDAAGSTSGSSATATSPSESGNTTATATTQASVTDSSPMETTATDSTPTDSSPTATDSGPADCPMGHVCLATVDGAWHGPFAVHTGAAAEPPPACPAGFTEAGPRFAGLEPSPFSCTCSCPDTPTLTCEYSITFNTGTQCDGTELDGGVVESGDCQSYLSSDAQSVSVVEVTGPADCGEPSWLSPMPSTWATRLDVCAPELGPECALGACVPVPPPPYDAQLCIFTDGDAECPELGPFDVRHVVSTGYDDARTCNCGCFAPASSCGGTLEAYSGGNCGGIVGSEEIATTACIGSLADVNSAQVVFPVPQATCQPVTNSRPVGEVTPVGVQTFCCTES